jgi:predicted transcriptional regulator
MSGPYNGRAPFEAGSATSEAAADSLIDAAVTLRERVYRVIVAQAASGTTDDEIEQILKLRHQTVSARRRELELLGRVERTADRRRTSSGRFAAVYVAVPPSAALVAAS